MKIPTKLKTLGPLTTGKQGVSSKYFFNNTLTTIKIGEKKQLVVGMQKSDVDKFIYFIFSITKYRVLSGMMLSQEQLV